MRTVPLMVVLLGGLLTAAQEDGVDATVEASLPATVWTWNCETKGCKKTALAEGQTPTSLAVCKLTCAPGVLWPEPTGAVSLTTNVIPVNANNITVETPSELSSETNELMRKLGELFRQQVVSLEKERGTEVGRSLVVSVILRDGSFKSFSLEADESYRLIISEVADCTINVTIMAGSYLGARHGLETLSQLIVYDDVRKSLVLPAHADITDSPVYKYRGILLDTARNYISVQGIKRTLDAMAANKLNTFHWHITDSQSFPLVSESFPKLTQYGAYSPKQVYTKEDVKSIVDYARVRGIRVLPEFDTPAHVGEGWQWAGDALVCFNKEPWNQYCFEPPCGQLNPTSEKTYEILEGIYRDMESLFDSDLFHMGGDEVNFNCWDSTDEVVENMRKMGLGRSNEDFHKLWSYFQGRAVQILEKVSGKKRPIVLWTSSLTERGHVDKYLNNSQYIIQIWTRKHDLVIKELLDKDFPVILSNHDALYLDCGFGALFGEGNNWCSPYIPWQTVYNNDPLTIVKSMGVDEKKAKKLVYGAEAALWTEQADDSSLDNRIWPRGSALAERLWTGKGSWKDAEPRFLLQRERLIQRGIQPDTVLPQWCLQNQGYCYK